MITKQEIRNDWQGTPYLWELSLEAPETDSLFTDFSATGRNGSFRPATVMVRGMNATPGEGEPSDPVATIWVDVFSKRQGDSAPIQLYLPREDAVAIARAILAATREES